MSLVFAAIGVAYLVVALLALLESTPPGSTWPNLAVLDSALFGRRARPVSPIERLLVAEDGPMNGGGTMRPAFTSESSDWLAAIESLTNEQLRQILAEREGERLALLDWVRSGARRNAYEQDAHPLSGPLAVQPLTAAYLAGPNEISQNPAYSKSVRIRSLINDRCAVCHSEDGRHEKARSFPLDNYDDLAYQCRPERPDVPSSRWLLIALAVQLPLACLAAACAPLSGISKAAGAALVSLTFAAAVAAGLAWWLGQPATVAAWIVAIGSAVFTLALTAQLVALVQNLLSGRP